MKLKSLILASVIALSATSSAHAALCKFLSENQLVFAPTLDWSGSSLFSGDRNTDKCRPGYCQPTDHCQPDRCQPDHCKPEHCKPNRSDRNCL